MIAKLTIAVDVVPHFALSNGLLKHKGKIWVGRNDTFSSRSFSYTILPLGAILVHQPLLNAFRHCFLGLVSRSKSRPLYRAAQPANKRN